MKAPYFLHILVAESQGQPLHMYLIFTENEAIYSGYLLNKHGFCTKMEVNICRIRIFQICWGKNRGIGLKTGCLWENLWQILQYLISENRLWRLMRFRRSRLVKNQNRLVPLVSVCNRVKGIVLGVGVTRVFFKAENGEKWPLVWPVTFDLLAYDLDLWHSTRYTQDTSSVKISDWYSIGKMVKSCWLTDSLTAWLPHSPTKSLQWVSDATQLWFFVDLFKSK